MYEKMKHQHTYLVTGEYQSSGKNLLGKNVACTIEKVICTDPKCKEENIRLQHE